ncbi:MAG: hypothetical protein V4462_10430 [Pseudomonadota bacterium]
MPRRASFNHGGALVELPAQWRPAPMQVSLRHPPRRQLSPRERGFVDRLAEVVGAAV